MTPIEKHELHHKKRMDKLEYRQAKKTAGGIRKVSYSKTILGIVLLLVFEVIIYAEVVMYQLWDLSALYVLIGAVVTAGVAAIIEYMWKSAKENTVGGITYDTAMKDFKTTDGK